jgi:hypothetical protein
MQLRMRDPLVTALVTKRLLGGLQHRQFGVPEGESAALPFVTGTVSSQRQAVQVRVAVQAHWSTDDPCSVPWVT